MKSGAAPIRKPWAAKTRLKASPATRSARRPAPGRSSGPGRARTRAGAVQSQGLGQAQRAQRQRGRSQYRQQQEHGAPALVRGQVAADDGRQRRRQVEHQDQVGHGAARHRALVAVAHDGLAHHDAGAGRQALQRARRQQPAEVRRGGGQQRAGHVADQGRQHHAAPAQRVGQRAMQQQHGRIAEHIDAERQLHGVLRHAEFPAQRAERRQVGVDGRGRDAGQQAQHEHHDREGRQGNGAGHGRFHGKGRPDWAASHHGGPAGPAPGMRNAGGAMAAAGSGRQSAGIRTAGMGRGRHRVRALIQFSSLGPRRSARGRPWRS